MNGKLTRRNAREWAVQMLTAADLNPPAGDIGDFIAGEWEQIESMEDFPGKSRSLKALKLFAEERVRGVLDDMDEIDAILEPLLKDWDMARLGTVERAVMRLGIWEIKDGGIPPPVAIKRPRPLESSATTSCSRSRKNSSPFLSNISGMLMPERRTISASTSTKRFLAEAAIYWPITVFPEEGIPTKTILHCSQSIFLKMSSIFSLGVTLLKKIL